MLVFGDLVWIPFTFSIQVSHIITKLVWIPFTLSNVYVILL
jgi:hypothetical protein